MSFEVIMRDCADHEDQRQRETEELEREEARLTRVTLAMAYAGDYERLRDVLDYRDLDAVVFSALVTCAQAGQAAAIHALETLAKEYGSRYAE